MNGIEIVTLTSSLEERFLIRFWKCNDSILITTTALVGLAIM